MRTVTSRPSSRLRWAAALPLLAGGVFLGCSPDLHETAGPRIPVPNVSGRLVRDDVPVSGESVRLEIAGQDSIVAETRTGDTGYFYFAEVESGGWVLRADSEDPWDFARVTYEFSFLGPDTELVAPDLDLSLKGLVLTNPEEGEARGLPDLFDPVLFQWDFPEGMASRAEARVYDADGDPVWYSAETLDEEVRWNGLGNQGDYAGQTATAGTYQWRLIVEGEGTLRFRTAYSTFLLED